MKNMDARTVAAMLPWDQLIDALYAAFGTDTSVPARAHHEVAVPGGKPGTLLLMPAWKAGAHIGVKIVSVFPDNAKHGIPAVSGSYLLLDARTGVPVALLDGTELTLRRTAAASALASRLLSREDASILVMAGTGNLAPHLVRAHCSVRPVREILIWGRRTEAARSLAEGISDLPAKVSVSLDIGDAVKRADIISCATLANEPFIRGEWLQPGQHIDLVGAFTPAMAEADSEAISRADVYVDTREGALSEAGEIVQAIAGGHFTAADIKGSLRELCTGAVAGRAEPNTITLFKSVGTAVEDLAAAELVLRNHAASRLG